MDAARVFTAVALFNMLVMPLNAFPWVINGLVEAHVSAKRINRLLKVSAGHDTFVQVTTRVCRSRHVCAGHDTFVQVTTSDGKQK